ARGGRDHRRRRRGPPQDRRVPRWPEGHLSTRNRTRRTHMALNRIWVYAEANEGKVSPLTLELLAKARELAPTVEAVYGGGDADAIAGTLGAHGASKVLATGDLGGSLPGVPVASAIAKAVSDGNGPDLIMLGTSYDGRDVA